MITTIARNSKSDTAGNVLFGQPPAALSSNDLGLTLRRFHDALQKLIEEPSFPSLILVCLLCREAFEKLIESTIETSVDQNAATATVFTRTSFKAAKMATRVIKIEGAETIRGMRAAAYRKNIERRRKMIQRIHVLGEDIGQVLCSTRITYKAAEPNDQVLAADRINELWRQATELKFLTGLSILEAELKNEKGPWALSSRSHVTFAADLIAIVEWMVDRGTRRCGLTPDAIHHITECRELFISDVMTPLKRLAEEYDKLSNNKDVVLDLAVNVDRGVATDELESKAHQTINDIRENRITRCIDMITSHSEASGRLTISAPASLMESSPLLHATIYELYREISPAEVRAQDSNENEDLRYNAMKDWVVSGRPGLAKFILSEMRKLKENISQPTRWRTALVLVGEHADPSEIINDQDRQSWVHLLRKVIESLTEPTNCLESQRHVLKAAIRTLAFLDPTTREQLVALLPNVGWDIRFTILRSVVDQLERVPPEERNLAHDTSSAIVDLVRLSLDRRLFNSGEIVATSLAGIRLLILTGSPDVNVLLEVAQPLAESYIWFRKELERLRSAAAT